MKIKEKLPFWFRLASRILFIPLCATCIILGCMAAYKAEEPTEDEVIAYTLKEYEGRIGIFRDSNSIPDKILDVYLITLHEGDARLLKEGIRVTDQAELESLIEDFSG